MGTTVQQAKAGLRFGQEAFDFVAAFAPGIILDAGMRIHPGGLDLEDGAADVLGIKATGEDHRAIRQLDQSSADIPIVNLSGCARGAGHGVVSIRDKSIHEAGELIDHGREGGFSVKPHDQTLDYQQLRRDDFEPGKLVNFDGAVELNHGRPQEGAEVGDIRRNVEIGDEYSECRRTQTADYCCGVSFTDVFRIDGQAQRKTQIPDPTLLEHVSFGFVDDSCDLDEISIEHGAAT